MFVLAYAYAILPQRKAAEAILTELQENPESWTRVDSILEHSQNQQSKFIALQACTGSLALGMSAIVSELVCRAADTGADDKVPLECAARGAAGGHQELHIQPHNPALL